MKTFIKKKYLEINKKKLFFLLIVFFSTIFFIYSRYNGNIHSDHRHIWLFLNGDIKNDFYETNSLPIQTSIFYYLVHKIGVRLDNDIYGIIFHLIFTFVSFLFLFKSLRLIFDNYSRNFLILVTLSICTLDNVIFETTRSSWIYPHNLSSSHIGITFFFIFLYYLLNFNKKKLSIISAIFLAISIKFAWFAIFCAVIYSYFKEKKFSDTLWVIPSVFIAIFYFIKFNDVGSTTNNLELFNYIIYREGNEVAVHLQDTSKIIFAITLFAINLLFLKNLKENKFFNLFFTVWICSLILMIFGWTYAKYGQIFYPNPKILILNAVRSQYFFQLLLSISYIYFVSSLFKEKISKYLLILLPFFLTFGLKGLIVAFIIILLSFVFINIKIKNEINGLIFSSLLIFAVATNSFKNKIKYFDDYTFKKINFWSTNIKKKNNFKEFFLALRNCEDFMLYDDTNRINQIDINFLSSKSKYFKPESQNASLNYEVLQEHLRRKKNIELILYNSDFDSNHFLKENFLLITKKDIEGNIINKPILNYNFYYFFKKDNLIKIKNNCKILFK